jgi:methylmalonyl-CoA mutase cobalamin-binding subunit/DNA-binding transcriptional MerR regulator
VIRVWEKRYGAVTPARTDTNRRLYSDAEIERLRLLARATEVGHKIGIIAKLEMEDLRRLVATVSMGVHGLDGVSHAPVDPAASVKEPKNGAPTGNSWTAEEPAPVLAERLPTSAEQADARLVTEALEATRSFRSDALQRVLEQGSVRMGHNGVLHRLICPFAQEIGELWQRGEVTAAHEHFASAVIRDFLMRSARPYGSEDGAPRAIVTTPAGQLHELGAVMVAAAAANLGWRPVYLGPSLPPAEIAGAALQNGARAVLLSIVYPADDRWLPRDLIQLRKLLPASVEIVVGGRAARAYADVLKEIGAISPDGLEELSDLLEEMREEAGAEEGPTGGSAVGNGN